MNPVSGLSSPSSSGVVSILQLALADECLLYTKVRHCYWSAASPRHRSLQHLFEKQYDELARFIDDVAEHIRSLGGDAMPTMSEFLKHTSLNEKPTRLPPSGPRMVRQVIEDHEAIIRTLRGDIEACQVEYEDAATGEFLGRLVKRHETLVWRLCAYLTRA